jgi:uncharacterized protein (UPF0303 family)
MPEKLTEEQTLAEIAALEELERKLVFSSFDQGDAWRLGSAAVAIIQERGHVLAVEIVLGDHTVFRAAVNGVSNSTDSWLLRKARVAREFDSSSIRVRYRNDIDPAVAADLDETLYAAHGGSVPIRVAGLGTVGTITVSGEPDTVDHEVAIAALEQTLR